MRARQARPCATARVTTTEAAVLALLALEGERSGYDLMKSVSQAIAYMWAPAKTQLYVVLPRLAKNRLVRARSVREGGRPEKQLYRITADGRRVLDDWLAAEPASRDAFFLRLFVGGLVPADILISHVEWFRRTVESELAEYRRIEPTNTRTGNDYYHYLLLRLGLERCEHLLAWADWVLGDLRSESEA